MNGWKEPEGEEDKKAYNKLVDSHMLNLDESCMMASDGTIKVIANVKKRKTEKNNADSRASITVVRVGSAAGVGGPRIFLAAGQKLESDSLKDLPNNHDAPPGSCVVMTPSEIGRAHV